MTEPQAPPATAAAVSFGEYAPVIIRGCTRCQSPRTIGADCPGCGNPEPAEVTDLGVVSAVYRNPIKQAWWLAVGKPLANRRIRAAAERTMQLRQPAGPAADTTTPAHAADHAKE